MQTFTHRALCACLALAWIGSATAGQTNEEEDLALVYGDKSTISIATGNRQPITRAPAVATVITARDIAAMGATDLDQVLESVPGLHVSMTNVVLNPIYSFRGIATKRFCSERCRKKVATSRFHRTDKGKIVIARARRKHQLTDKRKASQERHQQ